MLGDDVEICNHEFNYWDIRDAFFEFNQFMMENYQKYLLAKPTKPEQVQTDSNKTASAHIFDVGLQGAAASDLFSTDEYLKKRFKGKGYYTFMSYFTKTNLFGRYIELRVCPSDNPNSNITKHQEFFDWSYTRIRNKKMPRILDEANLITTKSTFRCLEPRMYDLIEANNGEKLCNFLFL